MEKLERVLCGLRECSAGAKRDCTKCPYWDFPDYSCLQALRLEALELLEPNENEVTEILRGYLGDNQGLAEEFAEEWDSIRKPDLISRRALLGKLEETDWYHVNEQGELVHGATSVNGLFQAEDVFAAVEGAAGVEAIPVRRGRWHIDKSFLPFISTCSECGGIFTVDGAFDWKFCPDCGAEMNLKEI